MTLEPTTPTGFDNDELLLMPSFRERVLNLEPSGSKTTLFGTIFVEVDMTDATVMRDRLAERWERSFGVPLTFNHMVLKAVAAALAEHPVFRPAALGDNHDSWEHVDLGVSVLSDN